MHAEVERNEGAGGGGGGGGVRVKGNKQHLSTLCVL